MSTPHGIVSAQLDALLALIDEHRASRCGAIGEQTETECRQIIDDAHREARDRMHRAVEQERERARQRLVEARAQLQTRARHEQYRVALTLLAEGWERLQRALQDRWQNREQRVAWCLALIEQALQVLPCKPWTIEHPAEWHPDELHDAFERLRNHCGGLPTFTPADDVQAGLRFCTDGACLDGTLDGLLTDRTAVEARLLASFHRFLGAKTLTNGAAAPDAPRHE